ncbi:hypothetical protein F5B19DRAFT_498274 [Rostrohypoxylon terebratum]|nr:hypothetical protein F5B19DRAFT_498274 [Rostrohypoxylon terebratum]
MSKNTYHITASGNSFVNIGHTYQSEGTTREKLFHLLFPHYRSSSESLQLDWDHNQARQRHVEKTGEWLLQDTKRFKPWLEEPDSFLWLHGIAGCGKTVLSSTIIDYLQKSLKGNNHIAGYYFNAREPEKRNVSRLIRSLLFQLCPAGGTSSLELEQLFEENAPRGISDDQLLDVLKKLIEGEGQTYIIIDALDECDASFESSKKAEDEKLAEFIQVLKRIVHIVEDNGTSRRNINLQAEYAIRDISDDIERFIDFELKRWNIRGGRRWLPLSASDHQLVASSVKTRANGMFRLSACLLDLLWVKEELTELKEALDGLPSKLSEVYDRIFQDIKGQGQIKTARVLLQWLLHSERPLNLEELTELTMVDAQTAAFFAKKRPEDGSYVSLTLSSFIVISENYLVQLAHQTVKEYLLNNAEYGLTHATDSQAFIARCCLSYMQFCTQRSLESQSSLGSSQHLLGNRALLEYVFNNWYRHAVQAWRDVAETLVTENPEHSSARAIPLEEATQDSELRDSAQSVENWVASVKLWLEQIGCTDRLSYHDTIMSQS